MRGLVHARPRTPATTAPVVEQLVKQTTGNEELPDQNLLAEPLTRRFVVELSRRYSNHLNQTGNPGQDAGADPYTACARYRSAR